MWIAHVVFSPCGETRKIAGHFYEKTGGLIYDFTDPDVRDRFDRTIRYNLAIFYLPVYSEAIPEPMRPWLKTFNAEKFVFNFTYGGKTWGDVPKTAADLVGRDKVVAWSVAVAQHAYCAGSVKLDMAEYDPIIAKINGGDLTPCTFPRMRATPLANFFRRSRERINYALSIDAAKCVHCNECVRKCPVRAITPEPAVTAACIRCAACAKVCPVGAIKEIKSPFLIRYLRNRKTAGAVVRTR